MILTSRLAIFVAGIVGGCLGEFLTLYDESRSDPTTRVKRRRDRLYWSMSAVMALIGGLVAIGYGFKEVRVFAAINIGASAPVLIKSAFANFGPSSKPNIN